MKMFLQKVKNELSQETVMHLVIYAFGDENSDVRTTILNGLFHTHKELLMNCFMKNIVYISCSLFTETTKIIRSSSK